MEGAIGEGGVGNVLICVDGVVGFFWGEVFPVGGFVEAVEVEVGEGGIGDESVEVLGGRMAQRIGGEEAPLGG